MYQHRWVMFCRYTDRKLDQLSADDNNMPFICWVNEKWTEFENINGPSRNSVNGNKLFDQWLLDGLKDIPVPSEGKGESPVNNTQQLKAEIAAIAKRCEIAPKSLRHHLILDTDLERLLQLSAV